MDYPNNFNIPAFRAGKTIALSRTVAVWISIVFFLIVAACGFIILQIYFKQNFPFLLSVDPLTDEWTVITYPKENKKSVSQYKFIQEKLVNDFFIDWFTISSNNKINEMRWQSCTRDDCKQPDKFNPSSITCSLACKSSVNLFEEFTAKVLPDYRARVEQANETWTVDGKIITPISVTPDSSSWQVYTVIKSSVMPSFDVLIFIDIARDIESYPVTFGYYVSQFNSYRIGLYNE